MRGKRGALPLALAIVGVGLTAPTAHAVVSTLYVQNAGAGRTCSDSGPGSSSQPFCTISKAASVVQPGQTVMVAQGNYPETVTITAKGTAAAPIRFVGQSIPAQNPLASWVGSDGGTTSGSHAFVLSGAQYVTLTGFATSGTKESVLVQNSQHVAVDQIFVANPGGQTPDVRATGSSNVTISRSTLQYGIELDSGTSGTTIESDVVMNGPFIPNASENPAILATDATGTTIVNDTITPACGRGVDLEGAATGSTIENSIIDTATSDGTACGTPTPAALTVAAGSTSGTKSDYNVVFTGTGLGSLYSWSGTTYNDLPSFTTATGQGGHDLAADPKLTLAPSLFGTGVPAYPTEGSPEIDSAAAGVAPAADIVGNGRVDDPLVANTGAGGIAYADRGAYEFQDPIAFVAPSIKHVLNGGPLDTDITTGVTGAWSSNVTFTYNFQDGTPNVVTTSPSIQHDFSSAGMYNVDISATDGYASPSPEDQNGFVSATVGAGYTPLAPVRILDTRKAIGVPTTTPVAPNSDTVLQVAGVDGIPSGNGLSAVVLNVTVTRPTSGGYLTVYPDGQFQPTASNLNFSAGETVPNLVTVQVHDGKIDFRNGSAGTAHIVADVEGYYADSGNEYGVLTPVRVLDTRHAIGVKTTTPVPGGGHLQLDLSSKVPAGTKAVTLNVTATQPTSGGYITVYPDGTSQPTASNLNFSTGETVPNLVTVPLDNGKVDFYDGSAGSVHLVADLAGFYGGSATPANSYLMPIGPQRVYDSRGGSAIGANSAFRLDATFFPFEGPLPTVGTGILINVTVTRPSSGGYLTVYPVGASRPTASNLNFGAGETVPNLVSTVIGSDGTNNGIDFYNGSAGHTDIVVDVEGYFVAPLA